MTYSWSFEGKIRNFAERIRNFIKEKQFCTRKKE